ncbi:MAG: SRPBCC family protein [Gemmatimonadota bacterium]
MTELETSIEIDASPERVWAVLTDFRSYPEWNPFVRRIEGELRTGSRLRVRLEPPGMRGMTLRPRLVAVEPPRVLRWLGHLGLPRLFDGEHGFRIEPLASGRVRFV